MTHEFETGMIARRRLLQLGAAGVALTGGLRFSGIAAQTPAASPGASRTIEHAMGVTELTGSPERVVALEFT